MNAWFGHSPHFTCGLPQTPLTHSLAQAGVYPERPVLMFSQRTGNTSGRPANNPRKMATFSAALRVRVPVFAKRPDGAAGDG